MKTIVTSTLSILLIPAGLLLSACDQRHDKDEQPINRSNIVAGYGEQTFPEKYGLQITLPISEPDFLAILNRLRLRYVVCGERGTALDIPPLRHPTTVDLSKAQKCYEIDGDRDVTKHMREAWRAFTDQQHQIYYIENVFSYTAP